MIHPTAIVHPEAQLDPSVEIGPWCTVGPHVKIAKGTRLLSHVVIEGWTTLGESNVIFPFSVLGAVPQDLKYKGERTELIIGDSNTIRESVTLNLGTIQGGGVTRIGDHNLLMAYVHLGHDCVVGNHCILANTTGLAGHVTIEDYANVSGMVGVSQFVRIGAYSYIAGQSGVERDVPPYSVAIGSRPCSLKGANIVGLRRRGFAAETIQKISEAIRVWSRSDLEKERALQEIEAQFSAIPEVRAFVDFIRRSETGVAR